MNTVVFIGGGRITSAMLAGLRRSHTSDRLIVHDRHSRKLRELQRRYQTTPEPDLRRAVERADLLLVAVRPQSLGSLLNTIGKVDRPLLAVSVAAGIPLRRLHDRLGAPVRWARAMPSPLCRVGRGLTAVTFPRTLSRNDRKWVCAFFSAFGQVIEIPETRFDAFTVTYSSSHGYHALAALAQAAQQAGLSRRIALMASAHALADGVAAWRNGDFSLDELLKEAATPGGIAATTMAAMDAAGYSRAIRKGLQAGLRRARANAK